MNERFLIGSLILLALNFGIGQDSSCFREANFGDKIICLPRINGYQECYSDSKVKQLADATEVEINSVLGFYLNNEIYAKKDSLGLITFDDYFKVYGTKEIQFLPAGKEVLDEMSQVMSGIFISKNWEELLELIDELGIDVEVGVPIVVENYRINEESFTMVLLIKYELQGEESYTLATTVNGYLSNNRLIWMAYYRNYVNTETIDILKSKSNEILLALIEAG
jgi:hypothetical protein